MTTPRVTALITVFNGEAFIARAVQSLLGQTLRDIEVLVLNDGSTDGTAAVLDQVRDERIRVIHAERMGRAPALAFACREARGEYIANLDADDISFPQRLEKQALFLDEHPDHAWVGCGEEQVDSRRGEHHVRIYPLSDEDIRRQCAKCIPYSHSGVMFRRSVVAEGINYDPAQPYLIDFEFFLRVAEHHKIANLPDVLVKRFVRAESFFQSRYRASRQNLRLAILCAGAVVRFRQPMWLLAFPIARLAYPLFPDALKRRIRRHQGLGESHA